MRSFMRCPGFSVEYRETRMGYEFLRQPACFLIRLPEVCALPADVFAIFQCYFPESPGFLPALRSPLRAADPVRTDCCSR